MSLSDLLNSLGTSLEDLPKVIHKLSEDLEVYEAVLALWKQLDGTTQLADFLVQRQKVSRLEQQLKATQQQLEFCRLEDRVRELLPSEPFKAYTELMSLEARPDELKENVEALKADIVNSALDTLQVWLLEVRWPLKE